MRFRNLLSFLFLIISSSQFANLITSTATGGNWSATTTWVGGVVPVSGDDVVIATTGASQVVVDIASVSVNSVTVNSGSTLLIQNSPTFASLTIGSGGVTTALVKLNSNITVTNTITVNNLGTVNGALVSSTTSCSAIVVNNGGTMYTSGNLSWTMNISNNVTINAGGIIKAVTAGANSSLMSIGGNMTVNGTFTGSSGSQVNIRVVVTGDIIVGDGGSFMLGGSTGAQSCNNLVIGGGTSGLFQISAGNNGSSLGAKTLNVAGNCTINAGATLNLHAFAQTQIAAHKLNIKGNLINNGTFTPFLVLTPASNGTDSLNVTLNGATTQTVGGTNGFSGSNAFMKLAINNTSGGVTLSMPTTVNDILTLTNGIVTTTSTNLLQLGNGISGLVSGGSASSFVSGPFARYFGTRASSATYNPTTLFPTGKNGVYLPMYLAPTTTTTGVILQAEAFTTNSGTPFNVSQHRWEIFENAGGTNLTNTFMKLVDGAVANSSRIMSATTASGLYSNLSGGSAPTPGLSIEASATAITQVDLTTNGLNFYTFNVTYPGGVIGPAMWLRADAGTSSTTDAATLTSWADQSGNVMNATGVSGPVFFSTTQSLNFNPVITFNGTSSYFTLPPGFADFTGGLSAFSIAKYATATNWGRMIDLGIGSANNNILMSRSGTTNSFNFSVYGSGGHTDASTTSTVITLNNYGMHDLILPSGTAATLVTPNYMKDGLPVGLSTTVYVPNNVNRTSNLIAKSNFADPLFQGAIPEIILYNTALLATQRLRIQSYLALKYGITLDQTTAQNYMASDGATAMWTASVATSGYNHNIFGIGRDDLSGLYQKVSASVNSRNIVTLETESSFAKANTDATRSGTLSNMQFLTIADSATVSVPAWGTYSAVIPNKHLLNNAWEVQNIGGAGGVYLQFNDNNTNYKIYLGPTNNLYLVYDNGGTITSGSSVVALTYAGGGLWRTPAAIIFSNGAKFTLATERVIYPGGVAQPKMWVRADMGVTLSGSNVTQWDNYANKTYPFTQATTSLQPTSSATGSLLNYNQQVTFDNSGFNATTFAGTGQWLLNTDATCYTTSVDWTNYCVGISTNTNGGKQYYWGIRAFGIASQNAEGLGFNASMKQLSHHQIAGGSSEEVVGTSVIPNNTPFLSSVSNTVAVQLKRTFTSSGASDGSGNFGSAGNMNNAAGLGIGGYTNQTASNNGFFGGTIAEVIGFHNKTLTTTERNKVDSYLALKYGITLKHDYLLSSGVTAYALDATYKNDIIGIVRDDASALLQKQSRQQNDSLQIYIASRATSNVANTGTITNDLSSVVLGHNGDKYKATNYSLPKPPGIAYRFDRQWKITNTNFPDDYTIRFKWDSIGSFNINDIRFLVDDDGNFSNAAVYSAPNVTITIGSIIVAGIGTAEIPINSTKYITIGSVSAATPLPIQMISFNATPENNEKVKLDWQTATEINNDYFTVERSTDASSWEEVTKVKGAGNSTKVINYNTYDYAPYEGLSYYRLKQTDFDQHNTYTSMRTVEFVRPTNGGLNVYPNPTNNYQVTIEGNEKELENLTWYNNIGQEVTAVVSIISKQQNKILYDLSKLSKGVYFVKSATTVRKVLVK